MNVTTIEELEEALVDVLGDGFSIETDNHGQLIIYTGLCEDLDGELVEFVDDEDLEEDLEMNPDAETLDALDRDDD
jgi:hypothetical protein